jgi:hypothetical protein
VAGGLNPSSFSFFRRGAALVIGLLLVAACSSGGKKHSGAAGSTTAPNPKSTQQALKAGTVWMETWAPSAQLDKKTKQKVLDAAQKYVDRAYLAPLNTGDVDPLYDGLFNPQVRGAATGADRNALTDRATGKASLYSQTATPVQVSALADGSGTLLYVATNFNVKVNATFDAGKAKIAHNVELTFARDGKDWTIVAYRVHTTRKLPHAKTTTTTAKRSGS